MQRRVSSDPTDLTADLLWHSDVFPALFPSARDYSIRVFDISVSDVHLSVEVERVSRILYDVDT